MKKPESPTTIKQTEMLYEFRIDIIERCLAFATSVIWATAFVAIAYFGYRAVACLSGKITKLDGLVSAAIKLEADRWIYLGVAAVTTRSWWKQRTMAKRAQQQLDVLTKPALPEEASVAPGKKKR